MRRLALLFVAFPGLLPVGLAACTPGYSPNTYASAAAQEEAAVQRGVIIGVRQVMISASGAIGTATGGAAGGVAGSQVSGGPVATALGAIGGTLVGGIGGTAAAQAVADTKGWEYIVDETGEKLISVTQTSKQALPIGLHVLVISGTQQARIVPDYTVQVAQAPPAAKVSAIDSEINISPALPQAGAVEPLPAAPIAVTSAPAPAATPALAATMTPPPASTGPAVTAQAVPSQRPTVTAPATSPAKFVQIAPGVSIPLPPANPSAAATP